MRGGLFPALLVLLCSGCESVVFEAPPVAAQPCDAALVGTWLSKGDRPGDDGEVELRIAADCTLLFVEHERDGTEEGEPTPLHVGRDGRIAYAWVDARWAEQRMMDDHPDRAPNAKPSFEAGDIVLMRYEAAARRLQLRQADPRQFAHRVIDEEIKGIVIAEDGDLEVRVTAPVDAKALRDTRLFRHDMRFVRAPGNE